MKRETVVPITSLKTPALFCLFVLLTLFILGPVEHLGRDLIFAGAVSVFILLWVWTYSNANGVYGEKVCGGHLVEIRGWSPRLKPVSVTAQRFSFRRGDKCRVCISDDSGNRLWFMTPDDLGSFLDKLISSSGYGLSWQVQHLAEKLNAVEQTHAMLYDGLTVIQQRVGRCKIKSARAAAHEIDTLCNLSGCDEISQARIENIPVTREMIEAVLDRKAEERKKALEPKAKTVKA